MRVVIIGGGISGLSLAWYLRHQAESIALLEASDRLGGCIRTVEAQGYPFELGPRSCRPEGAGLATLQLIEELGLADQVISAATAAHRRFLYAGDKLQALPTGPLSFLLSPLTRPLMKALLMEWGVPRGSGDETIDAFVRRRLGAHAADMLFDPMTLGIFAGDSRQLSMRACFPTLYRWEQTSGSLTRGFVSARRASTPTSAWAKKIRRGGLFSLRDGMESLTQALAVQLQRRIDIRCNCPVAAIEPSAETIRLRLASGESLVADRVYLAVPAYVAAVLLASAVPKASELLSQTKSESMGVVSLGYKQAILPHQGFGYLIPSKERESLLGMVWDSSAFPQHNRWPEQTRLTAMGRPGPQLEAAALEAAHRHLGIRAQPDVVHVSVAHQAIPQYTVGHLDRVAAIEAAVKERIPQLTLLGSSLYGVSINECIAHAQRYRSL